ncbi:S1C family serine protease [Chakrabartyella piscis]|uniref:S1C family serine protease n=1 Tax=Chakrabartyella piscis TaxID=2918914 RepID=UPI00295840F6|nr:trypsin-like peptidase domain-containing protein [Chakrabartyella piscis]
MNEFEENEVMQNDAESKESTNIEVVKENETVQEVKVVEVEEIKAEEIKVEEFVQEPIVETYPEEKYEMPTKVADTAHEVEPKFLQQKVDFSENQVITEEIKEQKAEQEVVAATKPEAGKSETYAEKAKEYYYEEKVKKAPKKSRSWGKFIVGCLLVSLVGGTSIGAGYGLVQSVMKEQPSVTITQAPVAVEATSDGSASMSSVDIVKSIKPSVVSISTTIVSTAPYFGSFSIPYEATGAGSGVIFYGDEEKIAIATNNHVIEGATTIYVSITDDETGDVLSVPAKVVGTKAESDLAVITVSWEDLQTAGISNITVAQFGDSSQLEVGEFVIAIGNAMGMGLSATDGMISMTEQTIVVDDIELEVIQTSAAINSGNSGGALVNSKGEVIGINTAKFNSSMAEGMGYAIPSDVIAPIVEELLENGTAPQPFIGIVGTGITEDNATLYRLPVGALIMEVTEGGPAEEAGVLVGDVVTEFDGKTIMDMSALADAVAEAEVGSKVNIHVIRDTDQSIDLTIVIGDKNE